MTERWEVNAIEVDWDGKIVPLPKEALAATDGKYFWVWFNGHTYRLKKRTGGSPSTGSMTATENVCRAPMTGKVTALFVKAGDKVQKGEPVAKMEAMKMQYTIAAPLSGKVIAMRCKVGAVIEADQLLVEFEQTS